jgi:hypothetical protein
VNYRGLARLALGSAGLVGLAGVARLTACASSDSHDGPPRPQDASTGDADASSLDGDTGSEGDVREGGESQLPEAKVQPPTGWHQWPNPPKDCALFVPDDIATVDPLTWEPCPFQPVGCTRAISPWGDENGGWGFAATISVAVHDGSTYLRVGRALDDDWVEALILRDNEPIAAWRYLQPDSYCFPITVVDANGWAGTAVYRLRNNTAPWVFLGPAETIMTSPTRTFAYGSPGFADAPVGFVIWSDDLLVLNSTGRFSIRDISTDDFERPWPPGITEGHGNLEDPVPVGRAVYYWLWTFQRSSVWVRVPGGVHEPLLQDPEVSYGWFATDGKNAVWIRSSGQIGTNEWDSNELWTSPLPTDDPTHLEPKLLAADLGNWVPITSVGEGWAAAHLDTKDVRLYRISDGLEKRLPEVPEYGWSESMYEGLVIAGGAVWVVTHNWPGSNQVRYVTRFDIDSLPTL